MKEKLSHFCIHVKDMKKAIEFYREKMGFEVEYETDVWSELKLNDKVSLALRHTPNPNPGIGFSVGDCKEATEELEKRGIKITENCQDRGDFLLTQFEDPNGNILWLSEKKEKFQHSE